MLTVEPAARAGAVRPRLRRRRLGRARRRRRSSCRRTRPTRDDLTLGDTVEAMLLDGTEKTLTVAGIYDYDVFGNLIVDRALFARSASTAVRLPGARAVRARRVGERRAGGDPARSTDGYPTSEAADPRASSSTSRPSRSTAFLNFIYALLGMSIFIADPRHRHHAAARGVRAAPRARAGASRRDDPAAGARQRPLGGGDHRDPRCDHGHRARPGARLDRRDGAARRGSQHLQRVARPSIVVFVVMSVVVAVDRRMDPGPHGGEGRHPRRRSPPPDPCCRVALRNVAARFGRIVLTALAIVASTAFLSGHVHLPRHDRAHLRRAVRRGVRGRRRRTCSRRAPSRAAFGFEAARRAPARHRRGRARRSRASPTRRRSSQGDAVVIDTDGEPIAAHDAPTYGATINTGELSVWTDRRRAATRSGPDEVALDEPTAADGRLRRRRPREGQRRRRLARVHARRDRPQYDEHRHAGQRHVGAVRRADRERVRRRSPGFIDAVLVRGDGTVTRRRARRPRSRRRSTRPGRPEQRGAHRRGDHRAGRRPRSSRASASSRSSCRSSRSSRSASAAS